MNVFSINFLDSFTAGIPVNDTAVRKLSDTVFATPRSPDGVVIAVFQDESTWTPFDHIGGLVPVSPPEMLHGMLLACQRDIVAKKKEALRKWLSVLLSTPMKFRRFSNRHEAYIEALQIRENTSSTAEAVVLSAYQRVWMIAAYVDQQLVANGGRKPSNREIIDSYKSLKMASESMQVSNYFVESAIKIHARAFSVPEVVERLQGWDKQFGSQNPLNKIGSLDALVTKAGKSKSSLTWVCNAIHDGLKYQYLFGGDLSVENLQGTRAGGGKGTLDLLMYKQEVLEYMTGPLVMKHGFLPVEDVDKLKKILVNHESYRTGFRESTDKSWWGKFPASLKSLFSLVEELIYSSNFDGTLKTAVKWKKGAEDLMEYERVKERLNEVLDCFAQEKRLAREASKAADQSEATDGKSRESSQPQSSAPSQPSMSDVDAYWSEQAQRILDSQVFLIAEPGSETALETALRGTPLATARGVVGKDHVVFMFDHKLNGEASSKPQSRLPPFWEDR